MPYQIENAIYDDINGIIKSADEEHKLTKTQKNLLNFFLQNPKVILSKQTLMDEVWNRVVTENSVDQIISILRNYLEQDPSNPNIIVTHFGKGISFEAPITKAKEKPNKSANNLNIKWISLLALVIIAMLTFNVWDKRQTKQSIDIEATKLINNKKILILPTKFAGQNIDTVEQKGIRSLMRSTFNNLDSEGQLAFDTTSLTAQQAIEKHWQLEDDLIVLRANIVKNGDIFESIIELSDGINNYEQTRLSANNINELVNSQIAFIADFNQSLTDESTFKLPVRISDEKYIKALGYWKLGDLKKAQEIIKQILFEKEDSHPVRLSLSEILYEEKSFDESLSQLNTLKSTPAYQTMGTEIELGIAKIKQSQKKHNEVIEELTNYQAQHITISAIKKAKIQLLLADAHLALTHLKTAMKFYKQAISNIDALLNPLIFAQSYFGQAEILLKSSLSEEVYALYKKAYKNALLAQNIPFQIKALNKMSFVSMNTYDWENAIKITNQVITLHELSNDKNNLGISLGTLVAIFNLRGEFDQAQDVNERLGKIAKETQSDTLQLHYLHYKSVLAMNHFDWISAQQIITEQLQLARKAKDIGMQLNNAFLQLELILLKKDEQAFFPEWKKRQEQIKKLGFERYQVYMDLYLARYYALISDYKKATELYKSVSENALQTKDIKIYVDAQTRLAKVLLNTDVDATLKLLNNLEQHNPHPNPYLDLKAQALHKLGKNIEALSLLNQAKLVYHESWTAENQALLELIKQQIK